MSESSDQLELGSSAPPLPFLPEDRRPTLPASAAAAHAKKVQSSIGACDACRMRKVRCLANESSMSSKCQRCTRANRECVYTTHSKTRRRKRTDTRVKELEEKVRGLSMLLDNKTASSKRASAERDVIESTELDIEEAARDPDEFPSMGGYGGVTEDGFSPLGLPAPPQSSKDPKATLQAHRQTYDVLYSQTKDTSDPSPIFPDVIDRGILNMETATKLYSRYVNDLLPVYPAVILPPDSTAAKLRETKPILFLAVLAASAGAFPPALNLRLNKEIQQVYATKVAIQGRKSLELVQAMLISILWTYPPDKFEDLKYHQQIAQAATMAMDLGLAQKHRSSSTRSKDFVDGQYSSPSSQSEGTPQPGMSPERRLPDSASLESLRTLLACYVFCASVAMSLRLPNMLRFSGWMTEALEVLEKSPFAVPTDKRFVAWVKLQRIVEECGSAMALDDPYDTSISLAEKHVQVKLSSCEKQLEAWKANNREVLNPFLEITYHANNIYLHEIALHPDHDVDDFRPPFFISVKLPESQSQTVLTPPYINAIGQCISSADALLTTFLNMNVEEIHHCPTLVYVRVVYASVILIKLSISASMPSSELGSLIDPESNKIDTLLEQLLVHLKTMSSFANGTKHVLSSKFLSIMTKLKLWFQHQRQQSSVDLLSNNESEQESESPETISAHQSLQATDAHGLKYLPAVHGLPWPEPPPQIQPPSRFAVPPLNKAGFFNDFAKGLPAAAVDQGGGTQSVQTTSWPTSYPNPSGYSEQQPALPFSFPLEADPSLFTHLVNAEIDQNNQDNWMTDADSFGGLDYPGLPDFNWATWPQ